MPTFRDKGIDVLADRKGEPPYVVLPPSNHISGNRYRWLNPPGTELLPYRELIKLSWNGGDGGKENPLNFWNVNRHDGRFWPAMYAVMRFKARGNDTALEIAAYAINHHALPGFCGDGTDCELSEAALERIRAEALKVYAERHPAGARHKSPNDSEPLSIDLLTFEQAADNPPPPLVDGHLDQASVGFVHGHPGKGKSWFAYALALAVASGQNFLGRYPVQSGRVVVWIEEGARYRIAQRFKRLRQGMGITDEQAVNLPIRSIVLKGLKLDRETDRARIIAELTSHAPFALLLIDNLTRIHSQKENTGDMSLVLNALSEIQVTFDAMVLPIHHDTKNHSNPGDSLNLRGFGDLNAWWRNRVWINQDAHTKIITAKPENKDGLSTDPYSFTLEDLPEGGIRLKWRAPVEMDDGDPFSSRPVDAIPLDVAVRRAVKELGFDRAKATNITAHVGKRKEAVLESLAAQVASGQLLAEERKGKGGTATHYRVARVE